MIGRSGERGSGISVLAARHDDDDDDIYIYNCACIRNIYIYTYIYKYGSSVSHFIICSPEVSSIWRSKVLWNYNMIFMIIPSKS